VREPFLSFSFFEGERETSLTHEKELKVDFEVGAVKKVKAKTELVQNKLPQLSARSQQCTNLVYFRVDLGKKRTVRI
jgi:hypothetical protein